MHDDPDVRGLARKLAQAYLDQLRAGNPYHQPWSPTKSVEESPVFQHFYRAALVVSEMDADPRQFIAAQFSGLNNMRHSMGKRRGIVWPQQLHTDYARLRYIEWMEERSEREEARAKPGQAVISDYGREEKKLKALSRRFRLPERTVLISCHAEFSESFLKQKGVLDVVQDD